MRILKVGGEPYEPKPFDAKPAKTERWYDRSTRCWIVMTTNDDGDQLGDATYVHSKREALLDEGWRKEAIAKGEKY